MSTDPELIAAAKSRIVEISAKDAIAKHGTVVFLDVREPKETNLGTVAGAVLCPLDLLRERVESLVPKDTAVVVYCAGGSRSALATDAMQQMGYKSAVSLAGGFREWAMNGGEVDD